MAAPLGRLAIRESRRAAIGELNVRPHHTLMSVYVFIAVVLTHWLLTVAACVLVCIWSRSRRRFWPCIILSVLAFLSSYYGVTRIRVTSSQTVNGHLQYYIDSRWFFIASLVLSVLALAYTLWKKWRVGHVAQDDLV